ncbi:MAG: EamA family transporter [Actinomycetes bacterium]|jgi:drug/metabolite transporter (DMT)-like permease|nr:EamA family transporter [Actinomycetes bacterium]
MKSAVKGHIAAAAVMIIWGLTFVSSDLVLVAGVNTVELLLVRFGLGWLLLLVLRPKIPAFRSIRAEAPFALCGLFGVVLYYAGEYTALRLTLVSTVGILVATAPLFTAFLSWAVYKKKPTKLFLAGFVLALAGIVLVGVSGSAGGGEVSTSTPAIRLLGDLLALLAAFTWAVYSVVYLKIGNPNPDSPSNPNPNPNPDSPSDPNPNPDNSVKAHAASGDPVLATRRIFFYGVIMLLAGLPFLGIHPNWALYARPVVWGNLLFLACIATALGYVAWNYAINQLGELRSSAYLYGIPVVTLLGSVVVLHEPFTWPAAVGIILITIGLILSERSHRT